MTNKKHPLVFAHRGASGYAPENTIVSFKKAMELGADGFELDVQLTKDGEIVVIHDEWLERLTDGKGFVRDYTLEQLRELNFNKNFPEYGIQRVRTLKEVYELVKDSDIEINVELKTGIFDYPGIVEKVLALAEEMNMKDRVIYSSFNHYTCVKIRELLPDARIGFLYGDVFIEVEQYVKEHGGMPFIRPSICCRIRSMSAKPSSWAWRSIPGPSMNRHTWSYAASWVLTASSQTIRMWLRT